ncbi:kinesin-like protein KIF11 isoform X2 [Ornithodoros turicata]|uniref:kinesin-like protein KIF11 isoform X2 n=1 Tax=Ornithodoros turicata TaxID=34597 RepID=UPI0031389321
MLRKNQHIQVFVRCRPQTASEKKSGSASVVEIKQDKKEVLVKDRLCPDRNKAFSFDHVFPGTAQQIEVYQAVMGPIINEVLMGYNCTVFAYGQTGTGKTYTMEGERSNMNLSWNQDPSAGIIPRTLHQLFETLQGLDLEFTIRVSFLELYNEELFDLLSAHEDTTKLKIFEDSTKKGSVIIQGLEEITVHTRDEVFFILEKGAAKRQTAATLMNATSSRSHTLFSITVHIRENTDDGEELLKTGKLNLVDLAGSENIGRSGAVDRRAREAGNINQSLLTLGRVITSLVDKAPHVPYRESKLTRLLQDSLGGRTKTSIIATISPAMINLDETLSTLDYAHRAKNITNRPEINQKMTKRTLIKEYTEEIERLRRDLVASREKNGIFVDEENYRNMETRLNTQSQEIMEKCEQLAALTEKLQILSGLFASTKKEVEEKTRVLNETSRDLDVTKDILNNTKVVLQKTEMERNEQQHLVKVRSQTEVALSQTASTLVAVARTTTKDIDLLQHKLWKKSEIDEVNKSHLTSLGDKLGGKLATTRQQIGERTASQKLVLDDIVGSLRALQQNIQEQWHTAKTFVSETRSCEEETASLHNSVCAASRQQAADALGKMTASQSNSLAQNKEAVEKTKTLISTTVEGTQRNLKHLEDFCESLVDQVTEACGRITRTIAHYGEEEASLLDAMCHEMEATSSTLVQETNLCEQQAQQLSTLVKEADQKMDSAMEAVYSQLNTIMQDRNRVRTMMTDHLDKVADSSSKATELQSLFTIIASGTRQAHTSMAATFASDCSSICTDIKSIVEDHTAELKKAQASADAALVDLDRESIAQLDNLTQAMGDQTQSSADANVHFLADHKTCMSKLDTLLEEQSKKSALAQSDLLASSERTTNDLMSSCRKTTERVQAAATLVEAADEEVACNVHSCKNLLAQLEKDMVIYQPTGCTPQRKDYPFPTELPHTSPDEVILRRLRAAEERLSPVPFLSSGTMHAEEWSSTKGKLSAASSTDSLASSTEGTMKENITKPKAKQAKRHEASSRRGVLAPSN